MPPHNRAPVAILTGPTSAVVGQQVVFDGSASHDPDHPKLASWRLFLGSGAEIQRGKSNAPNAIEWTPDLEDVGTVDVLLEVTDRHGITTTSPPILVNITLPDPEPVPPLTVACPDPIEVQADNPDGMVVSYPPPTVAGGVPPYAVESLPISGSVFPVGTTAVSVTVRDAEGTTVNCTFPVTILPQNPPVDPLVITTQILPTAVEDLPYAVQAEASGGIQPRTWTLQSGTLPPGITFNSDGLFSGIPTSTGSFPITIRVTDALATTTTKALSITVIAQTTGHPYFDGLIVRPDLMHAFPLRSQAEINSYQSSGPVPPRIAVVYDAVVDAMVQEINPAVTGTPNCQQKFIPTAIPLGTTILHTWDRLLDAGWAYQGTTYIDVYKTYRWDSPGGQSNPWFAMKDFWRRGASEQGTLTRYQATAPSNFHLIPPTIRGDSEMIGPQTAFYHGANEWLRTWVYYDAAAQRLSVWCATVAQGIVQLVNQTPFNFPANNVAWFRCENNTSFAGTPSNPQSKMWHRNMVVLQGLSYATAQSLLSTQGL